MVRWSVRRFIHAITQVTRAVGALFVLSRPLYLGSFGGDSLSDRYWPICRVGGAGEGHMKFETTFLWSSLHQDGAPLSGFSYALTKLDRLQVLRNP